MDGRNPAIYFQAHRGSVDEAPENTLPAFRHAWQFPGAVPETDVRTTRDGALVCVHDATLARTTDAPPAIRDLDIAELTLAQVRACDAGIRFGGARADRRFAGSPVPTLAEVFAELKRDPARRLYLEVKAVDLHQLRRTIDDEGVVERLLFVSGAQSTLLRLNELFPGVPTMTWIGGTPAEIDRRFGQLEATGFVGISQLQMHLHVAAMEPAITYALSEEFLRAAVARLAAHGAQLQLRPFAFDGPSLRRLIDLGVHWFVADGPQRFAAALAEAAILAQRRKGAEESGAP